MWCCTEQDELAHILQIPLKRVSDSTFSGGPEKLETLAALSKTILEPDSWSTMD